MSDVIRVFVGCAPAGEDAESLAVLEYTLRRQCSQPVEITWMMVSDDPASVWGGWNTAGWATPFSGLRWAIPEACGYRGRAIYMDCDVILRADIAELWTQRIPPGAMALVRGEGLEGGKLRTCVMLMDCAAFRRWPFPIPVLKASANPQGTVMRWFKDNRVRLAAFEGAWNCLDLKGHGLDDPAVKLIHYSQMAHQPHLKYAARRLAAQGRRHWYDGETAPHWRPELEAEFDALLTQAEAAGFTVAGYDPGVGGGMAKRSFVGRAPKVKTTEVPDSFAPAALTSGMTEG